MRLYEDVIKQFNEDVTQNKIADKISNRYQEYYKKRAGPSEINSWTNSMNFVNNVLNHTSLKENKIIIEHELPYSQKRIDVILFGKDEDDNDNIIILEIKQWSNNTVKDSSNEGNVITYVGKGWREMPHPSLQIEGYYWHLRDFVTIFDEKPGVSLSACVYCHNYSKGENEVLYLPKFKKDINRYPLFSKQDAIELGKYLERKLKNDGGLELFGRFTHSPLKPSKRLLDHTSDMINKQQIFNLIDEQITAYNTIMHQAKNLSKSKEKSVIIIKGGPGTGKSVIALEVMGELLRSGKIVYHATGSSAFTNTLRKILGVRSKNLFNFFFSFTNRKENEIDVLICDEAHRIRRDSNNYGVPNKFRSKNPQIDDLIMPSKLSIFFLDEQQVVRPNEIGSVDLIKSSAEKFNAKVYELPELMTQFRCSGSDTFLQWIENLLQIRESTKEFLTKEDRMEFKILEDPLELKKIIDMRNKEKKNCARMVAGFCWEWNNPNPDGSLPKDVKVGNLEMPWEQKNQFWKWAIDDSGMEQVGTVYTSQGFEFDYIGVIFGNDLIWDKGTKKWRSLPENSFDNATKRNNKDFTQHLKNIYRVLFSRAHKGVYVYFMDKDTEEYFKSKIKIY